MYTFQTNGKLDKILYFCQNKHTNTDLTIRGTIEYKKQKQSNNETVIVHFFYQTRSFYE